MDRLMPHRDKGKMAPKEVGKNKEKIFFPNHPTIVYDLHAMRAG
jgi:hypothetical protein